MLPCLVLLCQFIMCVQKSIKYRLKEKCNMSSCSQQWSLTRVCAGCPHMEGRRHRRNTYQCCETAIAPEFSPGAAGVFSGTRGIGMPLTQRLWSTALCPTYLKAHLSVCYAGSMTLSFRRGTARGRVLIIVRAQPAAGPS